MCHSLCLTSLSSTHHQLFPWFLGFCILSPPRRNFLWLFWTNSSLCQCLSFLLWFTYCRPPPSDCKLPEDGIIACFVLSWISFTAPDTEQALVKHLWMDDWLAQESYLIILHVFLKVIVTLHITDGNSEMSILQTYKLYFLSSKLQERQRMGTWRSLVI